MLYHVAIRFFGAMSHRDFIVQARLDDIEVTKAIATLRNSSRMMNLEYGQLRRRTEFSIQSGYAIPKTAQASTRSEHPTRLSKLRCSRQQSPITDPPADGDLFVVKTIHLKAKRPEAGQLSKPAATFGHVA
jgi:hypothetical protein